MSPCWDSAAEDHAGYQSKFDVSMVMDFRISIQQVVVFCREISRTMDLLKM